MYQLTIPAFIFIYLLYTKVVVLEVLKWHGINIGNLRLPSLELILKIIGYALLTFTDRPLFIQHLSFSLLSYQPERCPKPCGGSNQLPRRQIHVILGIVPLTIFSRRMSSPTTDHNNPLCEQPFFTQAPIIIDFNDAFSIVYPVEVSDEEPDPFHCENFPGHTQSCPEAPPNVDLTQSGPITRIAPVRWVLTSNFKVS